MQEHVLGVGEEIVIEDDIRLTILAVEAGEVLLGVTGTEPSDAAGPEGRQRRPRLTARPVPPASDN
jgi:hypothetical protein